MMESERESDRAPPTPQPPPFKFSGVECLIQHDERAIGNIILARLLLHRPPPNPSLVGPLRPVMKLRLRSL